VVIGDVAKYTFFKNALSGTDVEVLAGAEALQDVVCYDHVDVVLTALVGYAGLLPTVKAIKAGKPIALANKETILVGTSPYSCSRCWCWCLSRWRHSI
jgi:1-deoxy-D-xylulose-5-phosphate reductoisomerase